MKNWSEPPDLPENGRPPNNCPPPNRLVGPEGAERSVVFRAILWPKRKALEAKQERRQRE
ncbi:MAG TPA: hypothetical protein VMY37_32430 [Thermoguttaceae bacterium]|nr:hypothetical protein [Thermoguttaceae bacterium]